MSTIRAPATDVRAATLAAATRLFASQGFGATALQDIADAVGVTKPAVLYYYPSKELIREAVLDSIVLHWSRILPRLLIAASESHDRFDAVFGELVRFFLEDPDRARIILREVLDRPEETKKLLSRTVYPWLTTIAQYVQIGRDAGRHYADVDAEAYVVHVMQLVVAATACGPVTSSFLANGADKRYERELARMARRSLFTPASDAQAPTPRRRSRRR
jgi:AcrR family transcriptional regulator